MRRKPYDKYFDRGLKGWVVQTAQKNIWRMPSWYELDDLIQDGFVAFAICKVRYADRVENKAHFMALFKRVYISIIVDQASKRSRDIPQYAVSQIAIEGKDGLVLELLGGSEPPEQEFCLLISRASEEVKALLRALNDGRLAVPSKTIAGHRETTNEFFNRMLGYVDVDFEGQVQALLA